MKRLLTALLIRRTRILVNRFQPKVIAITGSVGKTSTRRAVEVVVSTAFDARVAQKNFNNEIGVPLAILGYSEAPGSSLLKWFTLLLHTYRVKHMPELLVLEYGIDHPGDMDVLVSIAQPDIGIFTRVSEVHAEYFKKGVLGIQKEKGKLIRAIKRGGTAVLNIDDPLVMKTTVPKMVQLTTFGLGKADIQGKNLEIQVEKGELRQSAHVFVDGKVIGSLNLKQPGDGNIYAALAALSVAQALKIDSMQAIKALNKEFVSEPGRMSVLKGVNNAMLIDDTYNAAPASVSNGLAMLKRVKQKGQRVACILGSMGELGIYSEQSHLEVGKEVASVANVFIAIGDAMKDAVESAKQSKKSLDVHWFKNSLEASEMVKELVKGCDIIYLKGSQSQRVERVTKSLLKKSSDASKLVRQSDAWLNR